MLSLLFGPSCPALGHFWPGGYVEQDHETAARRRLGGPLGNEWIRVRHADVQL